MSDVVKLILTKDTPITETEATAYASQLQSVTPAPTSAQIDLIVNLVKAHAKTLITYYKKLEKTNFEKKIVGIGVPPFTTANNSENFSTQSNKVLDNIKQSETNLKQDFN